MPDGVRSTWAAVAWAEGLILAGIALVGAAAATSARFCTLSLGCDGRSSLSGVSLVLAALGLVAIIGSPVAAARRSRWPAPGRAAALAALAFLVALVIGAIVFAALVDDVLPALVLALGVEGSIAVRPPSRRAVNTRIVVVVALVVLSGVFGAGSRRSDAAILLLALLTLPAIGVADTISVRPKQNPSPGG